MIEDKPSPEERYRMFENTTRGCESIMHDGMKCYILGVIKDGKLPDDGSQTAADAKKIISALGVHNIKDRRAVFLMSWDDEEQDSAFQLIGWTEFKRWKADSEFVNSLPQKPLITPEIAAQDGAADRALEYFNIIAPFAETHPDIWKPIYVGLIRLYGATLYGFYENSAIEFNNMADHLAATGDIETANRTRKAAQGMTEMADSLKPMFTKIRQM